MKKVLILLTIAVCAIQAFAQGYYVEMKVSMGGNKVADMKMFEQDGNSRVEVNNNIGGIKIDVVMLTLKNMPDKVYLIDELKKTYSESDANSAQDYEDAAQEDYEVTVLGKEKVNGYNSTHVRIKRKGDTHSMEMWTTTDIADYKSLLMIKGKYTGKENLTKALEAKGAAGFPVRVKVVEMNREMQVDLVKAESRSNPASMFSLTGFTKTEGIVNMGMDMEKVLKDLQNMTPEEREKMLKMLEQQFKSQPK